MYWSWSPQPTTFAGTKRIKSFCWLLESRLPRRVAVSSSSTGVPVHRYWKMSPTFTGTKKILLRCRLEATPRSIRHNFVFFHVPVQYNRIGGWLMCVCVWNKDNLRVLVQLQDPSTNAPYIMSGAMTLLQSMGAANPYIFRYGIAIRHHNTNTNRTLDRGRVRVVV
jgi:hypothetical protein